MSLSIDETPRTSSIRTGSSYQVKRFGNDHFLFASDFPHEIGPEGILHEIEEVEEYEGLSDDGKTAVLDDNMREFCQLRRAFDKASATRGGFDVV
jgi:predicted TIM-barrel fold metal-dependent hydrolase